MINATVTPLIGTAVIIRWQGKVLLAKRISKHENGKFGTPGGKLDFGESPAECIVREAYEETHLKLKNLKITGLFSNNVYEQEGAHYLCIWFEAEPDVLEDWDGVISFVEKDKSGNPKSEGWNWYAAEQLQELPLMRHTLQAIGFSGEACIIHTSDYPLISNAS